MDRLIDIQYRKPTEMVSWAANRSSMGMGAFDNLCTCATTKFIQCIRPLNRIIGISMDTYSVADLFGPDCKPDSVWDLRQEEFTARRQVINAVEEWCSENNEREDFTPILYRWEIAETSARRRRDWGDLIFMNWQCNRFLVVMCYPERVSPPDNHSFEQDFANLTKANAHRLMSLVKYLTYGKKRQLEGGWVRATYITDDRFIHPDFFDLEKTIFDPSVPVFHVNDNDFEPSILPHEMQRIDSLIATAPWVEKPPPEYKKLVMGEKPERPAALAWKDGNFASVNLCAWCGKFGRKMPTCAKCKVVRYCNKECQKAAWNQHTGVCQTWPKCWDAEYGPCPTRVRRSNE